MTTIPWLPFSKRLRHSASLLTSIAKEATHVLFCTGGLLWAEEEIEANSRFESQIHEREVKPLFFQRA